VFKNIKFPNQLVILCGGRYSPINTYTSKIPKTHLVFNDKPFLYFVINYFLKKGVKNFLLLTHYKNNYFKKFCKKYNFKNIDIQILKENHVSGKGIFSFKKKLEKNFFLLNGDILQDINLLDFIKTHNKEKKLITVSLIKKNLKHKLGRLNKNKGIFIKDNKSKYINSGLYLVDKKIINNSTYSKKKINPEISFENEIMNKLINDKKISTFKNKNNKFLDTELFSSLEKKKKDNFFTKKNKAVFLDRDGVLNVDYGYVYKAKDLKFEKKIFKILEYFKNRNYIFIIITNQSGIGRKYFNIQNVKKFNSKISNELLKKNINIQDIYICPHTPSMKCKCRKPSPKMVNDASFIWNIDKNKSLMIGDKLTDYQCSKNAGVKFFYKKQLEKLF
jgi:D-glycero-D-manno-heptose 1,7-bisphosphate phosphatase